METLSGGILSVEQMQGLIPEPWRIESVDNGSLPFNVSARAFELRLRHAVTGAYVRVLLYPGQSIWWPDLVHHNIRMAGEKN